MPRLTTWVINHWLSALFYNWNHHTIQSTTTSASHTWKGGQEYSIFKCTSQNEFAQCKGTLRFITKYSFGNISVNWIRKDASCKTLSLKIFINGTGTGTNKFYSPPFENTIWIIAMRAKACSKWKYLSRHLLTPQFGVQLNVKGSANWHPHLVTSIIRQTVIDKCGAEVEFGKFKIFTNSRVDWKCKF